MRLNNHAEGMASTLDTDLVSIELKMGSTLPWIASILEEIQYLRQEVRHLDGENALLRGEKGRCPACQRHVLVVDQDDE